MLRRPVRDLVFAIPAGIAVGIVLTVVHVHLIPVLVVAFVISLMVAYIVDDYCKKHPVPDKITKLYRRTFRIANRIYLSSPAAGDRLVKSTPPSPIGLNVDIADAFTRHNAFPWRIFRKHQWPYTKRTQRRLARLVRDLGDVGIKDGYLTKFLYEKPADSARSDVASFLIRKSGELRYSLPPDCPQYLPTIDLS